MTPRRFESIGLMLKVGFVGLVVALGWPVALTANSGSWVTKAPMPTARAEAAFGSINGQLFVAGGEDGATSLNTLEVYDPVSNTWSTKASMPTATHGAASAAINGRLYVSGGGSFATGCCFSTLEVYDPMTDTWTTLTSMPTPEGNAAAANVNGKLYVAGGISQAAFNNPRNALLQLYDPVTNMWATKASMPTARLAAEAVEINGKLYVVGGTTNTGYTGALEVYDPSMDTWTSKTPMPTPRQVFAAAAVNGLLYTIGGDPGGGSPQTAVNEVYDPAIDSWTTDAPVPTARYGMASGVVNGAIYVVGGATGFGSGVPQTVSEAFIPFAFLDRGSFVIGDLDAAVGNTVTFWGAKWVKVNSLSGGPAPNAFKGFAESAPKTCGGSWTSDPGNSSNPPDSVPSFMAVIVSSSITKSGPTISGDVPKIVIVQTNPGYGPSPGHAGTGMVVAVLCGS